MNVYDDLVPAAVDTLGHAEVFAEPLWRISVKLSAVECDLLRCWWVRRLGYICHAGAASLGTVQSYTRLEHSLGVFSLVAHFAPDDQAARVAALLHDVGHLPFSHTFEGVAGLKHHDLGKCRVKDLSDVLHSHRVDTEEVIDLIDGRRPSVLHGQTGGMRLDHLDSIVRSGRCHGRTRQPPCETLAGLRLTDGAVDTDVDTAGYLNRLVIAEARSQTSRVDLVAAGVMRDLARRILSLASDGERREIASMTDHEFWMLILTDPATRKDAQLLRREPDHWAIVKNGQTVATSSDMSIRVTVTRLYLDLPLIDGRAQASIIPEEYGLPKIPSAYSVGPSGPRAESDGTGL